MLEAGLFSLLSTDAGVSALVGTRIYPDIGPPDNPTYPYITYSDIAAHSEYALDGAEARDRLIQFDVWAATKANGTQVLTALRNALFCLNATLTDGTRVLIATRGNQFSRFDNDQKEYRAMCEYEFTTSEP
jgi:hypothetical protein